MARSTGLIHFTGTIGELTGYVMNGKAYFKRKSEVSKRKMRYDACYARTRVAQQHFKASVQLARIVYYELPRDRRCLATWHAIKNNAMQLLHRQGLAEEEVLRRIRLEFP